MVDVLTGLRLGSLCFFVYSTFTIHLSWMALLSFSILLATVYIFRERDCGEAIGQSAVDISGIKGKPADSSSERIPQQMRHQLEREIAELVTYDAECTRSIQEMAVIKNNTECIFAKQAKLWGSQDWNDSRSLEENIYRCVPTLLKFLRVCPVLGLDGFVVMLPGDQFGTSVQIFGQAVRRVLTELSAHDPADRRCMEKSYIGQRGWVFEFNKCTMFVTTFAPFYPEYHSRYAFGSENCFILLQPEISFAQHDLCPDTPHTNWEQPRTIRDRIRLAFRNSGRPYRIRETVYYPMAHDIVRPVYSEDNYIEWWRK